MQPRPQASFRSEPRPGHRAAWAAWAFAAVALLGCEAQLRYLQDDGAGGLDGSGGYTTEPPTLETTGTETASSTGTSEDPELDLGATATGNGATTNTETETQAETETSTGTMVCTLDPQCPAKSYHTCTCAGCLGFCEDRDLSFSDCTCPECASDPYCADPFNCLDDGACEPFLEGCVCADCADHWLCVNAQPPRD